MEKPAVVLVRRRVREKNKATEMTGKSKEENGRQPEKQAFLFRMLLVFNYPRRGPWNTINFKTHWWKNMYKEKLKMVQSLKRFPMVRACYLDVHGLTLEVSKRNYTETRLNINKHLGLLSVSEYFVTVYVPGTKKYTAFSSVHPVSNGNRVAILAGIVEGRFMFETGITVGHLFSVNDPQEEVKFGGGLVGRCCGKVREVVVDGETYTADIAAITFPPSPNKPIRYDRFNEIDINGKTYKSMLYTGDISSISPETIVWMVNQDGKLNIGKICRLLFYDKELDLHNVMQIASENLGKSFSKRGDSGCRVFLAPVAGDCVINVIGMVSSKVKCEKLNNETLKHETLKLTNAVWLGKILPPFLEMLAPPPCSDEPHPLSRDGNLPVGLNFLEGLEFSGLADKFENLSVGSVQPLCPEYDTGILVEGGLKELGPVGDLFKGCYCTPVMCSEDSLMTDGINCNSDVSLSVDSGMETLF